MGIQANGLEGYHDLSKALEKARQDETMSSSYTLYYWGACKKFWGRGLPIVVALDSSKSEYEIKDVPEDMGLSFALPIVEFPDGNRMSQLPMILEKRLSLNTFLAKHSPTVADFHGILAMESAIAKYGAIDASVYPKVAAWWTALNALPAVKKARELDIMK